MKKQLINEIIKDECDREIAAVRQKTRIVERNRDDLLYGRILAKNSMGAIVVFGLVETVLGIFGVLALITQRMMSHRKEQYVLSLYFARFRFC